MNNNEKFYCWNCGKVEIPEPISCCSGVDCGCAGMPIDPPFCSEECFQEYYKKRKGQRHKGIIYE